MDGWSGSATPDDDFIEILWVGSGAGPLVILLPGLGGSAWSPYATGLANSLSLHGFRVAILHARDAGLSPIDWSLPTIAVRPMTFDSFLRLSAFGSLLSGSTRLGSHWGQMCC